MDKQQNGLVSTAAFNPNNQYVITGGCDETSVRANKAICVMGFSKVWNVPAASEIADKSLDGMVNVSLFDHTGKKVLMGGCYNYNLKAEIPYCESSSLMVWDIDSGKVSGKLPKPGEIRQAAFNHDSSFVLTVFCHHYNDGSTNRVCVDSSTVIWSATSNWEKATIQQKGEINNAFFSPNSLRVISSGCDQYDFISGDPVCTIYKAHVLSWINGSEIQNFATNEAARAIEFSPDNKNVLTIKDKEIVVWEADSGNVVASMKSPVQKIYQAAFSPDGKRVIANSCDQVDASSGVCTAGSARLWDIATQKEIARMMQDGPVQSAAFNSDGSWLVSGGCDNLVLYGSRHVCSAGSAHVWKPGNPGEIAHFTQGGKVSYVAFSPDGKRVISKGCDQPACNTQSIIIWDALSGKATIIVGAGKINATSFSPDGKSVVSMGCSVFSTYLCTTSVINIWDAESGKKIIGPIDIQGQAADVQFSPDGKYLIQNSCRLYQNNHPEQNCILALVTAYDTVTGKITFTQEYDGQIFSLAFAPDGQKFSLAQCEAYSDDAKSVCTSGVVRVVDITSKKEDMKINLNGAVYSASFSPDGATLVTSGCSRFSADTGDCIFGFVRIMDAGTGKDTLEPMEYAGDVHQAIFSPDGQQVVSISRDGPFIVWDAATGKETFRSKSTKNILSVAYSQDGERIVTGSSDHTASVWDSATGVELARVTHDEGVNHVEFSPDGKWIVSGGDDGTVRVWPWATDELISLACERIPRNMTQKEWDEVIPGEDYRLTCPNLPKPAN
jgi:WD40 repeat protein